LNYNEIFNRGGSGCRTDDLASVRRLGNESLEGFLDLLQFRDRYPAKEKRATGCPIAR